MKRSFSQISKDEDQVVELTCSKQRKLNDGSMSKRSSDSGSDGAQQKCPDVVLLQSCSDFVDQVADVIQQLAEVALALSKIKLDQEVSFESLKEL